MARVILYFEKGDDEWPDIVVTQTQRKVRRMRREWNRYRREMRLKFGPERGEGGWLVFDQGRDEDGAPYEEERRFNEWWPQWNELDVDVMQSQARPQPKWRAQHSRVRRKARREFEKEHAEWLF